MYVGLHQPLGRTVCWYLHHMQPDRCQLRQLLAAPLLAHLMLNAQATGLDKNVGRPAPCGKNSFIHWPHIVNSDPPPPDNEDPLLSAHLNQAAQTHTVTVRTLRT